jgi:hypothetical protein
LNPARLTGYSASDTLRSMNDNAKTWVEALRSGDYTQGTNYLTYYDRDGANEVERNCCLGVACQLYIKDGNPLVTRTDSDGVVSYGAQHEKSVLPLDVAKWLGLSDRYSSFMTTHSDEEGAPVEDSSQLTELNDNGKSFEDIADVIESEPRGLFGKTQNRRVNNTYMDEEG